MQDLVFAYEAVVIKFLSLAKLREFREILGTIFLILVRDPRYIVTIIQIIT